MRAIYDKDIDVRTEIERHIFEETLRRFNEATARGLAESMDPAVITDRFLYELRTNNAVFSAFKTHRMQNDVAAQLIDPQTGLLKSFDKWKMDVQPITDHYVHNWLQTEYDTAVIRAHQAADWKHFLEEADVFPNVRWMPTTSVTPDPLHEHYWREKLTLPLNHPFWQEHRPGDRWNCKCSLQQTDDPVNDSALDGYTPPLPMPGLDNNPAEDGKIFSDTHPYYKEAYPGADIAVKNALNVSPAWIPAETIAHAEEFATQFVKETGIDRTFKGRVSYKGIDLTMANEINNTLAQAFSRFKMPEISGIKTISGSSATGKKIFSSAEAIAAYDPIQKGIYLNSDILGSPEKLNQYLKRSRDAFNLVKNNLDKLPPAKRAIAERYIMAGRELVDDSLQGMILHELGHHVQWNVVPTKLFNEIGDKLESIAAKISGYAGTNKSEYLAESFVSWFRGENLIDPRLKSYFDSNLKDVPQIQRVLKRSPSSLRRTEEERQRILEAWKQRVVMRENEKAIAKSLGVKIPKKGMTFDEANEQRSNPKLLVSRAYMKNCQCCVVSHELRLRGFDVEAIGRVKKEGHISQSLAIRTQFAWVNPKTNLEPAIETAWDFKEFVEKTDAKGRYHVRFLYKNGGGHIITFEQKDGKPLFYDPQTGFKYNLEEINKKYDIPNNAQIEYDSIEFYRVDKLTLNMNYIKAVRRK